MYKFVNVQTIYKCPVETEGYVKIEEGGKCEVNPESSPSNRGISGNLNKNARGRVNL